MIYYKLTETPGYTYIINFVTEFLKSFNELYLSLAKDYLKIDKVPTIRIPQSGGEVKAQRPLINPFRVFKELLKPSEEGSPPKIFDAVINGKKWKIQDFPFEDGTNILKLKYFSSKVSYLSMEIIFEFPISQTMEIKISSLDEMGEPDKKIFSVLISDVDWDWDGFHYSKTSIGIDVLIPDHPELGIQEGKKKKLFAQMDLNFETWLRKLYIFATTTTPQQQPSSDLPTSDTFVFGTGYHYRVNY